ncbi:MAG: D-alanyl-D-alanine carboxypeptidase, partial [Candidatus Sumerlaeia bacterium]|nr:D-alanyl-D-alanine carboxypeptidase [Candidatus Sumerlaeia bacterium]
MRLHQQLPLWVLAALGIPGVVSSQEIPLAVEAVLDRANIRDINWGYLIESADGNAEYYGRNADFAMVPASNTKIFTTAAGFGLLGETYAFRTRAFHTGTRNGATVTGDIILLGEHDITWHSDVFGSGNAARGLRTLAQKVRAAGITQINGAVVGQGAMIYNKSSTGTDHSSLTSTQNRNAEAAAAFRSELVAAGVTVINGSSGATGFNPPAGSTLIATYLSTENNDVETGRPLDLAEACIALNKGSHNGMADYLMRHIGYKITGVDTYQAGAQQSIAWFNTSLDVNTTGMILNDGSGLDRTNKVTPKQTVDVFREMTLRSPRWVATFPIGGVDGTLGGRLASIRGQVIAKTGTLPSSGSVSLSGFHNHPITGERYFFSIYANTDGILTGGTQAIDATTTRQAMDDSLVAFAGQRPAFAPDLLLTRTASDGTIRLEWNDPGFTTA